MRKQVKPNIYDTTWSHTIYKLQRIHYKITQSYLAYDVLYRLELLSISYDATKSYVTKSLHDSGLYTCQMYIKTTPVTCTLYTCLTGAHNREHAAKNYRHLVTGVTTTPPPTTH